MKCQSFLVLIFANFEKFFFLHIIITADTFQSHGSNLGGEVVKFYYVSKLHCVFRILPCESESKVTQKETRESQQRPSDLTFFIETFYNTCV